MECICRIFALMTNLRPYRRAVIKNRITLHLLHYIYTQVILW